MFDSDGYFGVLRSRFEQNQCEHEAEHDDHKDLTKITFRDGFDVMILSDLWCSFLKSRADLVMRHSLDYSINWQGCSRD